MAFTVEDGTGLAAANSYLAVADADTYHTDRGNAAWTGTDAVKQAALIAASQYVDTNYRFKGARANEAQAMEWPRTGVEDWSGFTVASDSLPARLTDAVAELALLALSEDLTPALDRGGAVKSEKVGSISITYADNAPATKVYQVSDSLLGQYITDKFDPTKPGRMTEGAPYYSPDENTDVADSETYFNVGSMDYE